MTITWRQLLDCFSPHCGDPREFYLTSFSVILLRCVLDSEAGDGRVDVPADWQTTGYADLVERERYARGLAPKLAALGVEVTGVPPFDPVRAKWGPV